jgi:hypothetical protein
MKIRIHETDFDGNPVACTGEYLEGANATEIVEAMKKNPFQIGLTVEEYMRKTLGKIGQREYVFTEDDAALEFLNLLAKLNYASFEEQEVKVK